MSKNKRQIFHVHGKEESIQSKCQFFPILSMNSIQSQSKYQQVTLWLLKTDSKAYYIETQKTQNSQKNIKGQEQSWRTDIISL